MPIEIRELHIKVMVNAGKDGKNAEPGMARAKQPGKRGQAKGSSSDSSRIVSDSVEQVLDILRAKKER